MKRGGGELHLVAPYNQSRRRAWPGELQPSVDPVCVSSDNGRRLASDGATSRLGGDARMGVFATRSTFRPNPIGMSLVELKGIRCQKDQVILELGSLNLVDGTPVVDIKPYLPFAEALPDASASYAQQAPLAGMNVSFTPEIDAQLLTLEKRYPHIKAFIREVLAQDPRPAYRKRNKREKRMPSGCWISTSAGG